jgi:hypothetical protein
VLLLGLPAGPRAVCERLPAPAGKLCHKNCHVLFNTIQKQQ